MSDINEYKKLMYDVIGAIHEVHCELGAGLNEFCYQEGLEMQLKEQGIPYLREQSFHPFYHNIAMESLFRIDFLCKGAQLFNYLRLLKKPCGILVNFAPRNYELERYFFDIENNNILGIDGKMIYDYKARRKMQYL